MSGSRLIGWIAIGLAAMVAGCAGRSTSGTERTTQALTSTQARVLGFEAATSDWHSGAGTLTASSTASQGSQSLAVVPAGWTEIDSVALGSLGSVSDTLSVDVLVPVKPTWGELRVILVAPSLQLSWTELGSKNLVELSPGAFSKVSFAIPANVRAALSGSYEDLTIKVVVNAEVLSQPYLLDNLVLTSGSGGGTGGAAGTAVELSVTTPAGTSLGNVFMSATDHLSIFSQAQVGESGSLPVLSSFGTSAVTYLQAEAKAYANLYSVPGVQLDAKTLIDGFVRTQGTISLQGAGTADAPVINGARQPGATVQATRTAWTVQWPATTKGDLQLNAVDAPTSTVVAPGAYGVFNIGDRNRVYLSSGTYFFTSFNTEPQAELHVNTAGGPIYIYVRTAFTYKGAFVHDAGEVGQVLVGYVGTSDAFVQAPFVGTLIAPSATIKLERPTSAQHRGAFFAKGIEVAAGQHTVLFVPFKYSFNTSCPLGDRDGDGVFDCTDVCNKNPGKVLPGLCGCDKAETDTDTDGVPDCIDECPNDATSQHRGVCGCPSDPSPATTACSDGVCKGAFRCDGAGNCGDSNACRPDPSCKLKYSKQTRHYYWFCDASVTWDQAATLCGSANGTKLVQINYGYENDFVAANASRSAPMWTGANDRTLAGEWVWAGYKSVDGDRFWTGGPSGHAYFARLASWSAAPAEGNDCGLVDAQGVWSGASCSSAAGFICEVSMERLDGDIYEHTQTWCEITGSNCQLRSAGPDCVSEGAAFGGKSEIEVLDAMARCEAACKDGKENTPECAAACTGPATPPSATETCPYDEDFVDSTPTCGEGSLVTPQVSCATTADCPSNAVCSRYYPGGGEGSPLLCVVPSSSCSTPPDMNVPCKYVDICEPDQPTQTVTDAAGAGSDLSQEPFVPESIWATAQEAPADPYQPDTNPCGGTCPKGTDHPWCHLGPADATPARDNIAPARAGRSDGSKLSFNFDPKLDMHFGGEIGAFGLPKIDAYAQAGFSSSITQRLAGETTFPLIDILAKLSADECGVSSEQTFDVLGTDFIAAGVVNPGKYGLPVVAPAAATQEKCHAAYQAFQTAGDRAKKALRDAVLLLNEYKARLDTSDTADNLPADLCRQVVPQAPLGFPAGNCPATGSTESPEATINRFIEYYRRTVTGFGGIAGIQGLPEALDQLMADDFDIDESFTFFSYSERKDKVIATAQFFIGPIPVFLEASSSLDFGVDLGALATFRAASVLDVLFRSSTDTPAEPIAFVQVNGTPHAGASLGIFAGAGFGVPGFKAQIGIQADLQLGTVYIPAYAGAGIGLGAVVDRRDPPSDIAPFASGVNLIPAKRYVADLQYTAGLGARIRDILSGSISGQLRLKLLFFKKTWRKTIFKFNGICAGSPDVSMPDCDFDFVSVGGAVNAAQSAFPWAEVRMTTPFPELVPLAVNASTPGSGSVPMGVVQEFFYDGLCTCINGNDTAEKRICVRDADCCDSTPVCYPQASGTNKCIVCRHRGEDCRTDVDCCGRPNTVCNTVTKKCEGTLWCGGKCTRDDECDIQLTCSGGSCDGPGPTCNPW